MISFRHMSNISLNSSLYKPYRPSICQSHSKSIFCSLDITSTSRFLSYPKSSTHRRGDLFPKILRSQLSFTMNTSPTTSPQTPPTPLFSTNSSTKQPRRQSTRLLTRGYIKPPLPYPSHLQTPLLRPYLVPARQSHLAVPKLSETNDYSVANDHDLDDLLPGFPYTSLRDISLFTCEFVAGMSRLVMGWIEQRWEHRCST